MPEVKAILATAVDTVVVARSLSAPPTPELTELNTPEPLLIHKVLPPASLTVLTLTSSVTTTVSPDSPRVKVLPAGVIVLTFKVVTR